MIFYVNEIVPVKQNYKWMKMSNETKIGILAIVAIAVLILGFNFLKGQSLFDKSDKLYAVFHKVDGLTTSNAVIVNGLQIGTVHEMKEKDRTLDSIVVTINLSNDISCGNHQLV